MVVVSPDVLLYHFGGYCLSDWNASCIIYKRLDLRQGNKIVDKALEDTYVSDNDVMPLCLSTSLSYGDRKYGTCITFDDIYTLFPVLHEI